MLIAGTCLRFGGQSRVTASMIFLAKTIWQDSIFADLVSSPWGFMGLYSLTLFGFRACVPPGTYDSDNNLYKCGSISGPGWYLAVKTGKETCGKKILQMHLT